NEPNGFSTQTQIPQPQLPSMPQTKDTKNQLQKKRPPQGTASFSSSKSADHDFAG
ncbi:MAG: hypothetical protein ACI89E_001806, partial [Planctomycetota bacterium]